MDVQHELILGGARSGKSRVAEQRAAQWLAQGRARRATLVATAWPAERTGDPEMGERIARHRADRAARIPALQTVEASSDLGGALRALDDPQRLLVVDCLTLWLTQCLMPPPVPPPTSPAAPPAADLPPPAGAPQQPPPQADWPAAQAGLLDALRRSRSPVVLVSNEIGFGLTPMSRELRAFVDTLGRLHQEVAAHCARVTLMVAGCPLRVKGEP